MTEFLPIEKASVLELVAAYTAIGIEQYELTQVQDVSGYNRLFKQRRKLSAELRRRGPSAQRALLPLLDHSNWQVKQMAAEDLCELEMDQCRRTFELIAQWGTIPQSVNAALALQIMDGKIGPFHS